MYQIQIISLVLHFRTAVLIFRTTHVWGDETLPHTQKKSTHATQVKNAMLWLTLGKKLSVSDETSRNSA
jgi:hypothetical protein